MDSTSSFNTTPASPIRRRPSRPSRPCSIRTASGGCRDTSSASGSHLTTECTEHTENSEIKNKEILHALRVLRGEYDFHFLCASVVNSFPSKAPSRASHNVHLCLTL